MDSGKQVYFPPFMLDTSNQRLQRDAENIPLRPKTLAVLSYLLEHPHRLISKEELMAAVWPKARVVDAALRVSIQEIRKALSDDSNKSKFIETVGKKGYRFIAPLSLRLRESQRESFLPFVGRAGDLDRLRHHLEIVGSKRQLVFVSGEPGIGKTTLVEAFLKTALVSLRVSFALGSCIEQFGSSEAYLPVLDLLERLCNLAGSDRIMNSLRQYAPTWLASLPRLITLGERAELMRQTASTTPERRMREIAGFLEEISQTQTVVLIFEDLHWADPSTLTLLSFLARRRETARLLIIATYREDEVERFNHPLKDIKAELQAHQQCSHLRLKLLPESAVGEYLAARLETEVVPKPLLSTVYRRSEGNPLFMVNITDYLIETVVIAKERGAIKFLPTGRQQDPIPETIRGLIERQVAGLSQEDRELLEVAAVAGTTFSVAVLARVLNNAREAIEARYRELMERTHYLQYAGLRVRPSGRGTPRYSFVHVLYQNVIYDRVDEAKRRRLHQTIGERTEGAYAGSTENVAAELAVHFERSGDHERAVKYLLQAAQRSFSVCAYAETIDYAKRALALADSLTQTAHRKEMELNLQLLIAVATCASKGYAAQETGDAFIRAEQLSQALAHDFLRFQALSGIWSYFLLRREVKTALKRARQLLVLAQTTRQKLFLLNAHMAMGLSLFYEGKFESSNHHLAQALPHYDREYHRSTASLFGWDPGVLVNCYNAQALWFLGFPDRAEKTAENAVALTGQLASPFSEALCFALHATYYAYRRDIVETLAMSDAALKIASDRGFLHWIALASINKGWALSGLGKTQEGLAYFLEGLKRWRSTGAEMAEPTFQVLLGEIYQASGDFRKALAAVEEGLAIAADNNDCHYDAELHRLKGELLLQVPKRNRNSNFAAAEACFLSAIDIARKQKTRSLELRAAIQLARLWQRTGRANEAHRTLSKIYGWFTEGFDTPDLKQAKALLKELG